MRQTQYLHNELLATTRNADSSKMRCCGCTWTYQGHRCPSEHILPQQACLCCREFTTSPRLAPSSRKHVVFKTTPSCTCYARCPNPGVGREKASKTMQLAKKKKGNLLLTRARAPAATNAVVQGQKSPEPKLLPKFIGYA